MKFGQRIKNFFLTKIASFGQNIPDETLEDLCDLLIEGDFGAAESYKITELLKEKCKNGDEPLETLCALLKDELNKAKSPLYPPLANNLCAVLVLGVNGVGKTTTAAKLCKFYSDCSGINSILAAADTFRAAAIDQLKIHGEKLGVRVIAHKQGADPAAVVFDALEAAHHSIQGGKRINLVIADTAGRMHTKSALVEELRKIDRVVESKKDYFYGSGNFPAAFEPQEKSYLKYLVLDATTGRNAFSQAEVFNEAVKPDGVILTKYDSTAKGGVVFSLASVLGLPVAFICNGEKYNDIELFNADKFVKEFCGID